MKSRRRVDSSNKVPIKRKAFPWYDLIIKYSVTKHYTTHKDCYEIKFIYILSGHMINGSANWGEMLHM